MLSFHSFLQRICQLAGASAGYVRNKMCRRTAALTAAAFLIAVAVFTSSGFGSGEKDVLAAVQAESGETEIITEAAIRFELTNTRREGQQLVGNLLEKEIQKQQEDEEAARTAIEKIKGQIQTEIDEKVKAAEEEVKRIREEEERRRAEERQALAVSCSDQDYQVLLKIVEAEAGGCDEKGRILVANVILNRVRSQEFPNTITGVVFEPSQFSPISDGNYYRVKVTQTTIDSVNRALAGEDYSQGALYFMNRRRSRSRSVSWFDSHLTYLFRYENHEFYK